MMVDNSHTQGGCTIHLAIPINVTFKFKDSTIERDLLIEEWKDI